MRTRTPHTHHGTIFSNHQSRSVLHHTLCAIQKVHKSLENITYGMYHLFQKIFPLKGIKSKRLGVNTRMLVKTKPYSNMKIIFFESYAMVYT